MDVQELLLTAARTSVVYLVVLAAIRLLGKRSVGAVGPFDLVVALMLGEVVDEIAFGDVAMATGLLAIAVIAGWHLINAWASYKSRLIDRLVEAEPSVVVAHGQIRHDVLARERLSEAELWSQLRLQSIDDVRQVKLATLESSGHVSVLKEEWAKPLEKGDLPPIEAARPQAA
jgi:uncharacterized membrane protein YcaP (DUF421 family)